MQAARGTSDCDRCGGALKPGQKMAMRKGRWIHAGCAPGGDDE